MLSKTYGKLSTKAASEQTSPGDDVLAEAPIPPELVVDQTIEPEW